MHRNCAHGLFLSFDDNLQSLGTITFNNFLYRYQKNDLYLKLNQSANVLRTFKYWPLTK